MSVRPDFGREDRPSTAQPPPVLTDPQAASVHDGVIADATKANMFGVAEMTIERQSFGRRKYGQSLVVNDGRVTLCDIAEELADAAAYLRKGIDEGDPTLTGIYWLTLGSLDKIVRRIAQQAEVAA